MFLKKFCPFFFFNLTLGKNVLCTMGGAASIRQGDSCVSVYSEAEQPAAPETTPEGEENAPAGSENK